MARREREIEAISVDIIHVGDRLRAASAEAVAEIAVSMQAVGMLSPITIRVVESMEIDGEIIDGVPVLIAGATRLAAAKSLGWAKIDTITADVSEVEARRHEIAENLHRSELTAQQRAEHVAEWVRLTGISRQPDAKPAVGRPEGGVRAAARELGINEPQARRAVQIASISDRAKQAAIDAHLDNNQSALLKVAAAQPAEQVEKVRELAAARDSRRATRTAVTVPLAAAPLDEADSREKWLAQGMTWWNRAPQEWRDEFLGRVELPVMDRRQQA